MKQRSAVKHTNSQGNAMKDTYVFMFIKIEVGFPTIFKAVSYLKILISNGIRYL